MNRLGWKIAGLIASAIAPGAAFAQDTQEPAQAQEAPAEEGVIVVTATGLSNAASSTKIDTPLIETPQTISVITRAEMDVRAVSSVSDALSYVAGVQAQSQGIDNRVDEVTVRGFGAGGFTSNNNFVDGLRLPTGGQWTRPGFDPFGLQQAEVLKGPSSVLYGQTAPGGIINLVSKLPSFEWRGEALLQLQAFTDLGNMRWQTGIDLTGPLSDTVAVRIVGLVSDGGNQPDGVDTGRYYISPSVRVRITPDTDWTVLAQYQRDEGGATFQFLPATNTLRQGPTGEQIPLEAYIGEPGWNQFDRNQYLIASFLEHRFGDTVTLRNNTRFTRLETLYRSVVTAADVLATCPPTLAGCIPGRTLNRRAVQGVGDSDGLTTDTQLQVRFNTGGATHTLLAGVDYFHTDWQHYRSGVAQNLVLPILDVLNPVPRGSAGYAGALTPQLNNEVTSDQTGVYLQDQIEIGNLRLALGGRYDWASDDIATPLNGRTFLVKSDEFTWRAGAVYLFDFGLAPYASYSTSFLPSQQDPSTNPTGEPFQPITGDQYEAGLRFQPPGQNIYVTLSAYQITQQNLLTPDPQGRLCGTIVCSVQTGEGRFRGLELEGRASLRGGLSVVGTVTHMDAEVTQSNVAAQLGKTLPQVPDWQASLFADYRVREGALRGLGLGGGVRYTGESWGDTNNTLAIPAYTLIDLFLRYDFGAATGLDGVSLSLNARNLFNEQFVATCTAVQACYYGQGRSVTARLQYRF